MSPALAGRFFTSEPPGKPYFSDFRFKTKLSRRYRDFPHLPLPPVHHSFCLNRCLHQNDTFATTDEPTLTHHNHPESRVWVHFLWLYILEVWTVDKEMLPAISVNKEYCLHQAISHCSLPPVVHPEGNSGWRKTGYRPQIVRMCIKGMISMNSGS